ncbi:MAG TPA: hypothetical protein VFE86_16095, partial [Ilumatobacteraceae bacterium]|nr:hypothetical protein [Ilumatobacteraceae bacterium]
MKWWRVGLISCLGIVLALYGYRAGGISGDRWMVVPPVIAALAAFVGARWRQNGDRVAWIAIAGSCAMTAAAYAMTMWSSVSGTHNLSDLASVMRAPDRTLVALGLLAMIADRSPIR